MCLFATNKLCGQADTLYISKVAESIKLDGKLNESIWRNAASTKPFIQQFPTDSLIAKSQSTVRLCYDNKYIYVGAQCLDPIKGPYIVQSLVRDFSFPRTDAFGIFLSPNNDSRNGFSFALNPYGVQREGVLTHGGNYGVTTAWDNKWFGESYIDSSNGYWSLEMAIPFRSIRYNNENKLWQLNFARNDQKQNEMSVWQMIPRNFNVASIPFAGYLKWTEPPPKAGLNYALIPYTFGSISRNYSQDIGDEVGNIGLDAKVSVSSALNLDLTVNPDFSQVEVDRQLINLTRFSLYYPEQRNFFLENSDLFSRFGFRQIRPFFSRRIGLLNGQKIPIIGGARLSGNLDQNWRIGIMNISTERDTSLNILRQNYSVAAIQRRLFKGSNIGLIMVNRQGIENTENIKTDYNRILGMDFNLGSNDGRYVGQLFYHKAFTPEQLKDNKAHASYLMYRQPEYSLMWNHEYVGKNYIAETGFVPRLYHYDQENDTTYRHSFWRLEPSAGYYFYPENSKLYRHGASLYLDYYADSSKRMTDKNLTFTYLIEFLNKSEVEFKAHDQSTRLRYPIDITGKGGEPLPVNTYHYKSISTNYSTNPRRPFTFSTNLKLGQFFNGHISSYSLSFSYRYQPWGVLSMNFRYDDVKLPEPYTSTELLLFGPKLNITLNRDLSWSTYLQYNTQIENININSRLRWRFRPMSDLYLVYTDNYDTYFYKKNRAFVLKFVYWLSP